MKTINDLNVNNVLEFEKNSITEYAIKNDFTIAFKKYVYVNKTISDDIVLTNEIDVSVLSVNFCDLVDRIYNFIHRSERI